ncbi:pilus assembly protein PilP [Colwellia hornerae]|uniref:Pilus assembly protein PilP n=1 Tax=Colwellia hornerae TaxID=89402 RepID=A0A5C6Q5A0_9GAMM|nr:pilus assembly protein PilP [Colwellia hornerae]TWX48105.1 pilus assembly protein PilP [Colwellia hornerae]TWX55106.1 pilus assembly protein PilP [Colwellia hornerae]TWX64002.1 pilus assembly protein PilP [Colwellia hornerae]
MKKSVLFLTIIIGTTGCFDDTSDLRTHIAKVHENTPNIIEPMPVISKFGHFDYSAQALRSPFDKPEAEAIQQKIQQMSGCLSPDPRRRKQPLEKYPLSNLSMRGTLGEQEIIWALVEASDATLHRVAVGSYLGLNHGRISMVNSFDVKVIELIPDGAGCWVERETTLKMVKSGTEGQGK